jgi:hypothetical protein
VKAEDSVGPGVGGLEWRALPAQTLGARGQTSGRQAGLVTPVHDASVAADAQSLCQAPRSRPRARAPARQAPSRPNPTPSQSPQGQLRILTWQILLQLLHCAVAALARPSLLPSAAPARASGMDQRRAKVRGRWASERHHWEFAQPCRRCWAEGQQALLDSYSAGVGPPKARSCRPSHSTRDWRQVG